MVDVQEKLALPLYIFVFLVYIYAGKGQREVHHPVKLNSDDLNTLNTLKEMKGFGNFYFTGWTYILQVAFVLTAILDELSKVLRLPRTVQSRLGNARAFIFHSLLFPCTLLVITFFWGLWHIDRSLIFPKVLDHFFPTWLNHALHTFIAVPLVIELLLPKRADFLELRKAATVLMAYLMVYTVLFISIYFRHGVWLYPVYKILTWPQKAALFVIQFVAVLVFQKIGISIRNSKKTATNYTQKVH